MAEGSSGRVLAYQVQGPEVKPRFYKTCSSWATSLGFLEGREIGFSSEYSKDKWRFIAKEQSRGQWMEHY
jgi:hypothetical protein